MQCVRSEIESVSASSLFGKSELSKDYSDFTTPYLVMENISRKDFELFWLECVDQQSVPRNYVQSLAIRLQLAHKVTFGNALDQQHSTAMLKHDLFLTADQAFFDLFVEIETELRGWPRQRTRNLRPIARPVLIDRSALDTVSEIKIALG